MTLGCPWRGANGRWLAHRPKSQSTPGHTLANGICAGRAAGIIVNDLRLAVATAMKEVRLDVVGATVELKDEIKHGGSAVVRTLRLEAGMVRAGLGAIVGNGAS